ncbi:MAG: NAD-dependent epimerase/dehydratase family protein [Oligoflexia bacterium]|nr:NAD-dependent epimerase/dehydratase family protein [Oligoflexia bacterium]
MKALVLGGNRFFGKRLVKSLLEKNIEVTLLNRGQTSDPFGKHVERIQMDRKNLDSSALQNRHWNIIYDQICYDANEAMLACSVFKEKTDHYVFTSSQSVYPEGENLKETSFDPKIYKFQSIADRNLDYAEAKRQAEATFYQNAKFPISIVRFPIVLGEDDYTERFLLHINAVRESTPIYFPNIKAKISFIHSQDAAEFLSFLAENPYDSPINCASSKPIQLEKLMQEISNFLGKEVLFSATEKSATVSPFGISSDWYMNTDKLKDFCFYPREITTWLGDLITQLSKKV